MRTTDSELISAPVESGPEPPQTPSRTVLDRVASRLADESHKAFAIAALLVGGLTIELVVAIVRAGCPTLNAMAWDLPILLDGGYRLLHGQLPHVDFYSPLGALILALVAVGMKIGGPVMALAWVHAILLPVLVLWSWALLRSRTSAPLAAGLSLWLGILAVAPRSIGFPPPLLSYAMQYNRWGWALLSIVCIELFLPRRKGRAGIVDGISTGAAAGLLLFLKINYFGMVALVIAAAFLISGTTRRWLAGAAASFLAVACAGFAFLGFHFGAFAADLRLLGASQNPRLQIVSILQLTAANLPDLLYLAAAAGLAALALRYPLRSAPGRRLWAIPATLAAVGIVTCSANYQILEIPLIYLALFVLVEQLRRALPVSGERGLLAFVAVTLMAGAAAGKPLYEDLTMLAAAGAPFEKPTQPDWPELDAPALRGLHLPGPPRDTTTASVRAALRAGAVVWPDQLGWTYPYVLWFNDGAALLRAHVSPQSRVLVLDYSNPFAFALGLTPPRGDALYWHWGRGFDEAHHPPASRVFREVTDVMIPKAPIHPESTAALKRIYGSELARDYRLTAESELWELYERR